MSMGWRTQSAKPGSRVGGWQTRRASAILAVVVATAMVSRASARPIHVGPHSGPYGVRSISVPSALAIGSQAGDSDDRLPRDLGILVNELVARGMPELVEAAIAGLPAVHRAHLARAYVRAGIEAVGAEERQAFFLSAAGEYRRVLELTDEPAWAAGPRRRLSAAGWRCELADVILRHLSAPDLDRYEITSGHDFDSVRLAETLRDALQQYERAERLLVELRDAMATDEDAFLLLGIAGGITRLSAQCRVNRAWAALYSAVTSAPTSAGRDASLASVLRAFDEIARGATAPATKYNALLAAGIALRALGRADEAVEAFERVANSAAPAGLTIRARYEQGKALMSAGRFDACRETLDALTRDSTIGVVANDGGAFYVRLASIVRAYSFLREAEWPDVPSGRKTALRKTARAEFVRIAGRGGEWADVARVYLNVLSGGSRGLDELTAIELRNMARRHMAEKRYADAARVLTLLLGRDDSEAVAEQSEARFNMGVCLFQEGRVRDAAEVFLDEARRSGSPPSDVGRRAIEYAYRCWRQVARASKRAEDCRRLNDAATILGATMPDHVLASEAAWVAALALEEAGDYSTARGAFARIGRDSERFWDARRKVANCAQRAYESALASSDETGTQQAAREAVEAWGRLIRELSSGDGSPGGAEVDRAAWIVSARQAKAAILASDTLRDFDAGLKAIDGLPTSPVILALRIRCLRGKGNLQDARVAVSEYLETEPGESAGPVLLGLAAELESEIGRLRSSGRTARAARLADETVEIMRSLLSWIESQPAHARYVSVVRFGLVKVMLQAGRRDEALEGLDGVLRDYPENGTYLRFAARLYEKGDSSSAGPGDSSAADRAEALWARLLQDRNLRNAAPDVYWEARYRWLRHQLRHGHAAAVVTGVLNERAWNPDLGGPPWQGRLLRLADEAREQAKGEQAAGKPAPGERAAGEQAAGGQRAGEPAAGERASGGQPLQEPPSRQRP